MQSDTGFSARNLSPLVPRKVIEIIDRTFRIYRTNFIGFIAITALVVIPQTILSAIISLEYVRDVRSNRFENQFPASYWTFLLVTFLGQFVVTILVNSIVSYITAENNLGRKPSIGEAFRAIRSRMGSLALGLFLFGLLGGITAFLLVFTGSFCFLPFLGLPILFYLGLAGYFYLTPILVLEDVNVGLGIRRAFALGKTRFWSTLGLYILVSIILFCVGVLLGLLNNLFPSSNSPFTISINVAGLAIQTFANILTVPVVTIALTLMYFDTRIRAEGLDIALDAVDRPEPRVSDVISPEPSGRLIAWSDVGNTILLTVGGFLILLVFGATAQAFLTNFIGLS